jgi:hypothetical protein
MAVACPPLAVISQPVSRARVFVAFVMHHNLRAFFCQTMRDAAPDATTGTLSQPRFYLEVS